MAQLAEGVCSSSVQADPASCHGCLPTAPQAHTETLVTSAADSCAAPSQVAPSFGDLLLSPLAAAARCAFGPRGPFMATAPAPLRFLPTAPYDALFGNTPPAARAGHVKRNVGGFEGWAVPEDQLGPFASQYPTVCPAPGDGVPEPNGKDCAPPGKRQKRQGASGSQGLGRVLGWSKLNIEKARTLVEAASTWDAAKVKHPRTTSELKNVLAALEGRMATFSQVDVPASDLETVSQVRSAMAQVELLLEVLTFYKEFTQKGDGAALAHAYDAAEQSTQGTDLKWHVFLTQLPPFLLCDIAPIVAANVFETRRL
jgi:hypothetical protein